MAIRKSPSTKSCSSQKYWLNIMIVSVSAMLLLSVLVGRMMDDTKTHNLNKVLPQSQPNMKISKIDFGELQLISQQKQWVSSNKQYPQAQVLSLIENWQELLLSHGQPVSEQISIGKTVLIYLFEKKQPLVAKIHLLQNEVKIVIVTVGIEFSVPISEYSYYYPLIK